MKRKKKQKHYSKRNRHHLRPKSRGGNYSKKNLLLINEEKHCLWHQLWGNRTLEEVISLLQRLQRAKAHTGE